MRAKQVHYSKIATLTLTLTLVLLAPGGNAEGKTAPAAGKNPSPAAPWTGPVPEAACGSNDRVETGLQGQTTSSERVSGASMQAYNCNLELVGQFTGEGAKYQMAWFGDCAYYGTTKNAGLQHPGTVVIDASDPRNPRATAYLDTPAMLDPHESLKVHQERALLAGVEEAGPGFDVYDLSTDCRHPILKSSINLADSNQLDPSVPPIRVMGHAGDFTPDGLTYYSSQTFRGLGGIMPVVDISDPANPKQLLNWQFPGDGRPHDPTFNKDGTRLYSPQPGQFGNTGSSVGPNGLVISDVSDVQARRPNPQIRVVSTLFWEDGGQAQVATPATIKGRPYLIFTDELGSGGVEGREGACARGLPPYGFARIIDISDEKNPKIVSKLMLDVHDPGNCSAVIGDTPTSFGYDSHYCTVDRPRNARLAACSYFQSGVRVFDIRDPYRPKEVAYYKPGAVGSASRPGSTLNDRGNRTYDYSSSNVRFVRARGKNYLWFTSHDNGFQIVRFTKRMRELLDRDG